MNIWAELSIIWPRSLARLTPKKYSLCFSLCVGAFIFTQHVNNVTSSLLCGRFHPIALSSIALLTYAPPHFHLPLSFFFLIQQKSEGYAAAIPSVLQLGLQPHLCQPGLHEAAPRCSEVPRNVASYFHSNLLPFIQTPLQWRQIWSIHPQLPLLVCYHPLLCFLSPQGSPNRVNFQSSYQWPSFGHQWLWGKSSPLHPL